MSVGGAIVSQIFADYKPSDYVRSFRQLADDIESGRVKINRLEVTKAGKGGPNWLVQIHLSDSGGKPI